MPVARSIQFVERNGVEPDHSLTVATVARVALTIETMAGSPDRLLGLFVADPTSGDGVHHHPLRRIAVSLPLGGQLLPQGWATKAMLLSSRFGEKIRADTMFVPSPSLAESLSRIMRALPGLKPSVPSSSTFVF